MDFTCYFIYIHTLRHVRARAHVKSMWAHFFWQLLTTATDFDLKEVVSRVLAFTFSTKASAPGLSGILAPSSEISCPERQIKKCPLSMKWVLLILNMHFINYSSWNGYWYQQEKLLTTRDENGQFIGDLPPYEHRRAHTHTHCQVGCMLADFCSCHSQHLFARWSSSEEYSLPVPTRGDSCARTERRGERGPQVLRSLVFEICPKSF